MAVDTNVGTVIGESLSHAILMFVSEKVSNNAAILTKLDFTQCSAQQPEQWVQLSFVMTALLGMFLKTNKHQDLVRLSGPV